MTAVQDPQLLLIVISGLAFAVSTITSFLVKMLSSRFTKVESAVESIKSELILLDKTVAAGYVPRLEMQQEITKVLNAMRDDRLEILHALHEITIAMANTVKREECMRLHKQE